MEQKQIIQALVGTGLWGEQDAELGLEADFSCQYCGKDLFESVDSYKEWQTDHLIPVSSGGEDSKDNYVICCRTCNFIKGRWNPLLEFSNATPTRSEQIEAARGYIHSKRRKNSDLLREFKAIIGRE